MGARSTNGSSLTLRLAITLLGPLAMVAVGDRVPLPGVPLELTAQVGMAPISLFALGVMPIISGFWIVEVVAFLVPRLSRLRHDDPAGRAKLDRASRIVAFGLATIQAWAMALTIESAASSFEVSKFEIVVSLVAGAGLQFVLADIISRQRIVNGFLALLAASALTHTGIELLRHVGLAAPSLPSSANVAVDGVGLGIALIAIASIAAATFILLRGAGARPHGRPPTNEGSPYRDARKLALHPVIPLPASSFQAYAFAFALLGLPATLANLHVPFPAAATISFDGRSGMLVLLALTTLSAWLFARLLHRPAELRSLVDRLGGKAGPKFEDEVARAVRAALPPTFLFFAVVVLAGRASQVGALSFALVVPIGIDLAHSIRLARRQPELVPIWDERRAAAIPIVRAMLASEGITTEIQGTFALSFWQVFVPIAPAVLLVRQKDAERAVALFGHLLLGAKAPARATSPDPVMLPAQQWSLRRRSLLMLAPLIAAAAAFVALEAHLTTPARTASDGPRAKLELCRVDDSIDPFANVSDDSIPVQSGIGVYVERVPLGANGTTTSHFARISILEGESKESARRRFADWLASFALPAGARFGFEEIPEENPETKRSTIVGFREFVLIGDPILDEGDVTDARALAPRDGSSPYVALTLSADGGKQFERATREWTGRRMAIVVDDTIAVAPVIRSVITGGHLSITLGEDDPESQLAKAKTLAKRLMP